MLRSSVGASERSRQLNVAVRETHVLTLLGLDPSPDARSRALPPPRQRRDSAGAVALEVDSGLDGGRDASARTGEKAVAARRIERPSLTGFIERDELIRPRELAPHLEVQKGILVPPVGAVILAERPLVQRHHT